jgi:hypothetical protein
MRVFMSIKSSGRECSLSAEFEKVVIMNMEPVEMVLLAGWDQKTLTQTTVMAILIERW